MRDRPVLNIALPTIGFVFGLALWSVVFEDWRPTISPLDERTRQSTGPQPQPLWASWSSLDTIFVFGDSNSETYFDPLLTPQPDAALPFGNTLRLPNSTSPPPTKWIQHLALSHNASALSVFDLARNNASVERYAYTTHPPGRIRQAQDVTGSLIEDVTFNEQVDQFQLWYTTDRWKTQLTNWTAPTSLFTLWFGMNDIDEAVMRGTPMATHPIFASYMASLERLYTAGARNFLLLNTPPMERIMPDPYLFVRQNVRDFNAQLRRLQRKLLARHRDATVFLFDAHTLLADALDEPSHYPETAGLVHLDQTCPSYWWGLGDRDEALQLCGQPRDKYFWHSHLNISAPVHELLGRQVAAACFGEDGAWGLCSTSADGDENAQGKQA